jgi:predicted transcriptional regulator of viral defense system
VVGARRPLLTLSDVAGDQWGLVTLRQARRLALPSTTLERLTAPGASLERVAHGVYKLAGAPIPDHMELRAAWLQLEPTAFAWERNPDEGVVSHRSAAALYGLGHLAADRHEFTLPKRRQTRRADVRLHIGSVDRGTTSLRGLPVTRPSRTAADLVQDHEDIEAVAQLVADAIRGAFEYPGTIARTLSPYAKRLGFRNDDGIAVLRWFLDMTNDPQAGYWLRAADESLRQDKNELSGA